MLLSGWGLHSGELQQGQLEQQEHKEGYQVANEKEEYSPQKQVCEAMYDLQAQVENQVSFAKGDILEIISSVDANW